MKFGRLAIAGVAAAAVLLGVATWAGWLDGITGAVVGSVAGIETPPLDDPAMIRRGAAHYEIACAGCHASPDRPDRADALDLSPPPPRLHVRAEGWSAEQMFLTVKNGVRGTGMPAWPTAERDDEIWAMVAFLQVLPDMDPDTYRGLAGLSADIAELSPSVATCARCHGVDGRGHADGAFPRLDIQAEEYLLSALEAFREGRRASGFMQSAVAGLTNAELAEVAGYYGSTAPSQPGPTLPVSSSSDTPNCTACHGPPTPSRPEFPSLTGQYEAYLLTQFRLLADKERPRGGGDFIDVMHEVARVVAGPEAISWITLYAGARDARAWPCGLVLDATCAHIGWTFQPSWLRLPVKLAFDS